MSNVLIKNCNNIKEASIVIEEGNLNIKFAINGTGKSMIAKALLNNDIWKRRKSRCRMKSKY